MSVFDLPETIAGATEDVRAIEVALSRLDISDDDTRASIDDARKSLRTTSKRLVQARLLAARARGQAAAKTLGHLISALNHVPSDRQ